jgi:hypothetical protein
VLVSAEEIIERRRIRANSFVASRERMFEFAEQWGESLRERHRSQDASAKNYRTHRPFKSDLHDGAVHARRRLFSLYLAAAAMAATAFWLALR